MTIRRNPARDERRRRVLVDERLAAAPRTRPAGPAAGKRPRWPENRYASAARQDQQPRITDILPRRTWTLALWYAAGALLVALHLGGVLLQARWWPAAVSSQAPSLQQLTGRGTLGTWTASVLLLLSAAISGLIFHLRRHRMDDYRGSYRLWGPVLALLLLASIDTTAGLVDSLTRILTHSVPATLPWAGGFQVALGGGLLTLAVRMGWEMRPCRTAVLTMGVAAVAYLSAAVAATDWFSVRRSFDPAIGTVIVLAGHTLLLLALVSYARYVFLDAQGQLSETAGRLSLPGWRYLQALKYRGRRRRSGRAMDEDEANMTEPTARPEPSVGISLKLAQTGETEGETDGETPPQAATPTAPDAQGDAAADPDPASSPGEASRAERRKARKENRRQRRAA